ncbi:spindle and kinetochore-associated protein 2 isoform X1 [Megalops cyprinoides]|uniref:spindle and kinetochore-associated protein 2 isoform X1 n=1 Tax=Megalops cyprinoides TaxID=118141 RepID=UPI0018648EDA|nr:spindle and kinetochore-associated protein 2 isoform X1 [Megalops cyprinoides]
METAVNELEAMFQKAEADLEYIEKQLKSEFLTEAPESGDAEENPIKLLENLSAVKVQYKALCAQMEAISVEQKQSVESIRAYLNNTLQLVQELQQTTDIEAPPLTEKEKEAAEFLGLPLPQHAAASLPTSEPSASEQLQSQSKDKFVELSKAELEAVPRSTRSNTKLADLNDFYRQLFEHFATRKNSKPLSLQQMKKMNPKVNDAMLKTLKHLSVIKMDNKGHVCLAARE